MRLQSCCTALLAVAVGLVFATAGWAAGPHEAPIRQFADTTVRAWLGDPRVIDAIREQNVRHAGLKQSDIDALDRQWRSETSASTRPLIERAAVLDRVKRVDGNDWYFEGAMQLLARQGEKNGDWNNPAGDSTPPTCFALLFLKRGTSPLGAPVTGDK